MRVIIIKSRNFSETPIFYFLDEISEKCDKIAIFYCEPSKDVSNWISCNSKGKFFIEVETLLKANNIKTIIFVNTKNWDI